MASSYPRVFPFPEDVADRKWKEVLAFLRKPKAGSETIEKFPFGAPAIGHSPVVSDDFEGSFAAFLEPKHLPYRMGPQADYARDQTLALGSFTGKTAVDHNDVYIAITFYFGEDMKNLNQHSCLLVGPFDVKIEDVPGGGGSWYQSAIATNFSFGYSSVANLEGEPELAYVTCFAGGGRTGDVLAYDLSFHNPKLPHE